MKIFIIGASGTSKWSGSDGLWIQTAKLLCNDPNTDVYTISPLSTTTLDQNDLKPTKHYQIPAIAEAKSRAGRITRKLIARLVLAQLNPSTKDVILFSQGSIDTFLDRAYRRWLLSSKGKLVTLTQLNTEYQCYSKVERKIAHIFFTKAEANVFVSYRNLETARRQFLIPIENGVVIYNSPKYNISPLKWPEDKCLKLACIGRFETQTKGQVVLIQALSKFREVDWKLSFFGAGPDESMIQEAIQYYDLTSKCKIRGHVNHPSEIWKDHHVLCLTSTMEGFPLVISEAMLSQRICLVSDVGGNSELLLGPQKELIALAPNPICISKALEKLFELETSSLKHLATLNLANAKKAKLDVSMNQLANVITHIASQS